MPNDLRPSRGAAVWIATVAIAAILLGCGPTDPAKEARALMAKGDLTESLEVLRDAIAETSEDSELLFLYGKVLVATGQPGLAEWPLRKAVEDPVWFERAAALIGTVEQAGGNHENAAEIYQQILDANPDNMVIRIRRANVCAKSPQLFEEALAEVDRILEIDPEELGAFKPRILAYLGLNQPDEAEEAIIELGVRIDEGQPADAPIRGWHCATMAIFASDKGDLELAAERWAACEEEFPTHSNVVSKSIEFHKKRGELERALEVAENAFAEEAEEGGGYRLVVADILQLLGRWESAESLLLEGAEQAQGVVPEAASLLALVEHYKAVGNSQAAADTLERTLALLLQSVGPQADLLFSLADLYITLGDDDRALELTNQMTVAAHRALVRGRIAQGRQQYTKALQLYDEATRLWPENPYAPYHAARAALSVGQFDLAFKSYLLSVRIEEGATDARFQAARLMQAEGRLASALEMIGATRLTLSPAAEILRVQIFAQMRGSVAGSNAASRLSQYRPDLFGQAIAAAAKGASQSADADDADEAGVWAIMEPLVGLEFPPVNGLPILLAALRYAPGEAELATLKTHVESAVAAHPDSAEVREIEGLYFERSGAFAKAETAYALAIEADSTRTRPLLRLAGLEASSDPEKALELAERSVADQISATQAFDPQLLLVALVRAPDSPGLEALLRSALALAPTDGPLALRLATVIEARNGEASQVLRLANRAIRFQVGEDAVALRDAARQRL